MANPKVPSIPDPLDAASTMEAVRAIKSIIDGLGFSGAGPDLADALARLTDPQSPGIPVGTCLDFPCIVLPASYLWCDGASYLRADHPALFLAIGTSHGTADALHFNVPDRRGRFPRGQDEGTARDPDAAGRTAMAAGGNAADNLGSVQTDAMQGHWHRVLEGTTPGGSNANAEGSTTQSSDMPTGGPTTDGVHGTPRTSSETRPVNFSTRWIIKT